jgi:hypothetical protein
MDFMLKFHPDEKGDAEHKIEEALVGDGEDDECRRKC